MDREVIIGEALELLGDVEGYICSQPTTTDEETLLLVRIQRVLDKMQQFGEEVYARGTK